MAGSLAQRWKLVHGEKNWEGMLEPLDSDLRHELIRYGEFIEAVYDSLDEETDSKYQYYPLYGKSSLFANVGLGNTKKYNITRYFYSTEKTGFIKLFFGPTDAVWMGFIAVSDDEETARLGRRDIVVVFRGTQRNIEWIYNCRMVGVPFPNLDGSTKGVPLVHKGFLALYDSTDSSAAFGAKSMRQQIIDELRSLINAHKGEEVSITVIGHSLGGALATLCAYDICNNKVNEGGIHVSAFTYASPKVGSVEFKRQAEAIVKILRLVDRRDIVPMVPPPAALYKHQGVEFKVDGSQSPYFKFAPFWSIWKPHNLEAYLHIVAGFKKYFLPPSVVNRVVDKAPLPVPVKAVTKSVTGLFGGVVGGVTGAVTTTVSTVTTTVAKVLPIDQLMAGVIGNDAEGLRVYNALKELFEDDPESLQEFLLNVVDVTRGNMGTGDNFEFAVKRDIALVNKRDDILKDECEIPKAWWIIRNRNMVQGEDMTWLPRHKRPADTPSPDNPEFL